MARRRHQSDTGERATVELARRLGTLLSELGLSEIDVAVGEVRIRLQRGGGAALAAPPPAGAVPQRAPPAAPAGAPAPPGRPVRGAVGGDLLPGPLPAAG